MVAAIHSLPAPRFVLVSSIESVESGVVVGLLVEQNGQVLTKPIAPVTIPQHDSVSLFDEPVTWEDAEWR
jgi:hypothetical protein